MRDQLVFPLLPLMKRVKWVQYKCVAGQSSAKHQESDFNRDLITIFNTPGSRVSREYPHFAHSMTVREAKPRGRHYGVISGQIM